MKYLKMLGLAAVAAMAITAFVGVGTASATGGVLCETTVEPCPAGSWKWETGKVMHFSLVSGSTALLESTGGFFQNTCTGSTVTGTVTRVGSSTEKAKGSVEASGLTWSGCSGATETKTGGTLEITGLGSGKGTVFASDFVVTSVVEGFHCFFQAGTTNDLGELTTPDANHLNAVLHINAIVSKIDTATHNSSAFCPSTARWTATYQYTATNSTKLVITKS